MAPPRVEPRTSCTVGEHANRCTTESVIGAKSLIVIITVFTDTGHTKWSAYSQRFTAYVSQLSIMAAQGQFRND